MFVNLSVSDLTTGVKNQGEIMGILLNGKDFSLIYLGVLKIIP